jgi:TIR domain
MNEDWQYNTFLSWSGEHSHEIAALLRDWLPNVVPSARPWISSEDIAKGLVWPTELNQSLASCDIGVVVLTPDDLDSPWLLFEAGVLFKARGERPVFTLCCGVEPPIVGPLGQFQTTRCDAKDMLRLVQDINSAIGGNHDKNRVQGWFEKFWPEFSQKEKIFANRILAATTLHPRLTELCLKKF